MVNSERKTTASLIPVIGDDAAAIALDRILIKACDARVISYEEAESIAGEETDDALMLGWEWRLLIPVRTARCAEWDDRMLMLEPGERYEIPNITRVIVYQAIQGEGWHPSKAIADYFKQNREPAWERMPLLVEEIKRGCRNGVITAEGIAGACRRVELGDRVDTMIAIMKGAGVMSPRLGSLNQVAATGVPLYELNPCLLADDPAGRTA